MESWSHQDQAYIMSTVNRLPIAIEKATGNYLYDTEGKAYLDLVTGLGVNVVGHSHPTVLKALTEQGNRFLHISNLFLNPPAIRLAKRLLSHSLVRGKVYFANSGAEATEATIKLIHKWCTREQNEKRGVVVMKNSFHGRTMGAIRLTRQPGVYQDYPEIDLPVYEVEGEDLSSLEAICHQHQPAAILLEPVLGAGGVYPLSPSYLQGARRIADQHSMLLCIDEIQTGMGRTGKLFAYQHSDISPDVILFAKGVGGGLPLGGIIANANTCDLFQPGDHGTTFAPSPLSSALGNAVLDILLEQEQLEMGKKAAAYLWQKLIELQRKHPHIIKEVRGLGMMLGIRTSCTPEQAQQLQRDLYHAGILVNVAAQTVIRLLPPLTLQHDEIDHFIFTLDHYINHRVSDS
ncbi:aspartate aminotransferase family protein [Mechercharimyces sp. CAU 1602]|uniref:aspartate aminotransferase family protein n=1 Tax=Mechercharimyces sp. CAU 1602 TaxID=2973933 RepID=UPI002162CCCC|nr:acetylornithine transaminase [Mechercharimyces sp. CAU 1602]MCS1351887.1 acetylornithine transaminase [Mechercharimyces sp. CAU 1602]